MSSGPSREWREAEALLGIDGKSGSAGDPEHRGSEKHIFRVHDGEAPTPNQTRSGDERRCAERLVCRANK